MGSPFSSNLSSHRYSWKKPYDDESSEQHIHPSRHGRPMYLYAGDQ